MKSKTGSDVAQVMIASVVKTFSDMAFIDVVEAADFLEKLHFSHIIHISLFEPQKGEITLFLPSECKKLIVENIYGEKWDTLHATEIDDCLLEILNVLAGNFLNGYCDKDVKHNISLPELLFDEASINSRADFTDFYFDAEGIPFKVSISF
jgi:hypothetical protein